MKTNIRKLIDKCYSTAEKHDSACASVHIAIKHMLEEEIADDSSVFMQTDGLVLLYDRMNVPVSWIVRNYMVSSTPLGLDDLKEISI